MKVLLTGAAGGMGLESLKQMAEDKGSYQIVALDLDNERCRERLKPYADSKRVQTLFGDLTDAAFVEKAVRGCDLILHMAAFVSPAADYHPKKAMEVNFGGTRNLIEAVKRLGQNDTTRFVYIGTVAETGDRMPPIHWGRAGDPIKPSMFDYYAVSKIAAERYVIESGLKYWVSLRQTGIMGPAMAKIRDAIQFHKKASQMDHFTDWDKVIPIDHGYDESKLESELTLTDLQGAAKFRGGECLSESMKQGDWQTKQTFRCAFGHTFDANPG